jgi:hypothetical protein
MLRHLTDNPPRSYSDIQELPLAVLYDFILRQRRVYGQTWYQTYASRTRAEPLLVTIFSIIAGHHSLSEDQIQQELLPFSLSPREIVTVIQVQLYFRCRDRYGI